MISPVLSSLGFPPPRLAGPGLLVSATRTLTCVVDDEASIAHRCVAAEGKEQAIAAALDAARELGAIEASYERAERVPSVVDMEEVIARLQVKAGEQKHPTPTPLRSNKGLSQALGLPDSKPSIPLAPQP